MNHEHYYGVMLLEYEPAYIVTKKNYRDVKHREELMQFDYCPYCGHKFVTDKDGKIVE